MFPLMTSDCKDLHNKIYQNLGHPWLRGL